MLGHTALVVDRSIGSCRSVCSSTYLRDVTWSMRVVQPMSSSELAIQ